MFKKTTM